MGQSVSSPVQLRVAEEIILKHYRYRVRGLIYLLLKQLVNTLLPRIRYLRRVPLVQRLPPLVGGQERKGRHWTIRLSQSRSQQRLEVAGQALDGPFRK